MTDPLANASPESVADQIAGTNGGNPLSFELAAMLFQANILGLSKDYAEPEGPNVSPALTDHATTLAKVLTRTHKHVDGNVYDAWDAIQTILKWVLLQSPEINNDEVDSVNFVKPPAA